MSNGQKMVDEEVPRTMVGSFLARIKGGNAWKWWLMGVLFLATVLTYLDRQTLSLCGPMIRDEFKLSNEQYGQLVSAFRWSYAFTHIPAGFLADHFPIRLTYALAVGLWSLAGAAAFGVRNLWQLLFTRGALGVGEGFNWPCATRIVANVLPPADRGLASGIFNSGAAVGSLIAPFIITPIAMAYGWRWAFLIIGVMGAFWIALWIYATRRNSAVHKAVSGMTHATESSSVQKGPRGRALVAWMRQVLLHPGFWMLMLVSLTVNPCWYFLNEWVPNYMRNQRGLSYLVAGLVTVPIFLAADVGNLLSGGCIKLLTMRGWSLRLARGATLAVISLFILPIAFIGLFDNVYIVVGIMALAGFGLTSIIANNVACQQDLSFGNVGIVAGIMGMSSNVLAAVVNPYIGRYVDRTGQYTLVFVMMAILPLISVLSIVVFDTLIHGRRRGGAQE